MGLGYKDDISDRKSENTISGELHYLKIDQRIMVIIMNLKYSTIEHGKLLSL